MTKQTTPAVKETENTVATQPNPFDFSAVQVSTGTESRRLDYTPSLIDKSNARAQELMMTISKKPELFELANKAIDGGEPKDLIELISQVFSDEQIEADSKLLEGCDENQLSRLLESRRSDRSKAKAKNPRTSITVCKTYIASMYAELLIRKHWNRPYTGQVGSNVIDYEALGDDQDAISRKVKSLQSKKSRLTKLASYDKAAAKELQEIIAEIARLNELRPSVRTVTRAIIKDLSVDQLREVLKNVDLKTLSDEEQAKFTELMTKLG